MDPIGSNMPQPVTRGLVLPAGEDLPMSRRGQDTPSESSEAESSECDTTGDEDGWESGESSTSLVVNHRHYDEHLRDHLTHMPTLEASSDNSLRNCSRVLTGVDVVTSSGGRAVSKVPRP